MVQEKYARAGDAGVKFRELTTTSTTSSITATCKTQHLPGADECVWRLGNALRAGRIERDSWAFGFTLSLLRNNKRRSWKPSAKQLHAMRNLVAELATPDAPLIDEDDSDEAA